MGHERFKSFDGRLPEWLLYVLRYRTTLRRRLSGVPYDIRYTTLLPSQAGPVTAPSHLPNRYGALAVTALPDWLTPTFGKARKLERVGR